MLFLVRAQVCLNMDNYFWRLKTVDFVSHKFVFFYAKYACKVDVSNRGECLTFNNLLALEKESNKERVT